MKRYATLLVLLGLGFSQCTSPREKDVVQREIITTASGLKYYYLKKGSGPRLQKGSLVKGKVKLYINDSLIWHNDTINGGEGSIYNPDSKAKIAGMRELDTYLREGDKVVAIMPPSLTYGERGTDDIPPNATLVFHKEILEVSAPKKLIAETLVTAYKEKGLAYMFQEHTRITTTKDSVAYHKDFTQLFDVGPALAELGNHKDAMEAVGYFQSLTPVDWQRNYFRRQRVKFLQESGQLTAAYDSLLLLLVDEPKNGRLLDIKEELEAARARGSN